MIIDQLPLLSTDVQGTDEIPIERGTSAYKTTQAALVQSVASTKAPINHASSDTTYGVGNYSNYGHVKLTDTPDTSQQAGDGYAATPAAVANAPFVSYAQAQSLTDAQQEQARENIGADWVLLWTNASPTSNFAAQTISLNLSAYKFVCIAYGTSNAADSRLTHLIHEKGRTSLCTSLLSNKIVYRSQNGFTDSGIVFGNGVNVSSYGSGVDANDRMIPMKIYGIRG